MESVTKKKLTSVVKLLTFVCILISLSINIYAQDIEVKKFEQMEKDQTAMLSPQKDINGNACGQVKVLLKKN